MTKEHEDRMREMVTNAKRFTALQSDDEWERVIGELVDGRGQEFDALEDLADAIIVRKACEAVCDTCGQGHSWMRHHIFHCGLTYSCDGQTITLVRDKS